MPAPAATAGTPDRTRCYLRGWVAFGPGYWNGGLYTRAECAEMGRLFDYLRRTAGFVPKAKIGHDQEQQLAERLKASLGFPALGTVTGLRVAPDGLCAFDLELPAQIGALCNAKVFTDCSIEIAPLPDPSDATRKLYPVLTALSLLGEEQPAVPLRYPMPRAVYADGTPVPPASDLTPLAQAMAQVARTFCARARPAQGRLDFNGRTFATAVLCFSAMNPLTPKGPPMTPEQKAALAAANFTPEQIAAMEAALANPNPPAPPANPDMPGDLATMSKKFAMDDQTPPYAKEMMSAFAAFASDWNKRFSAMEAAVKKTEGEAQMAAKFSADYAARVEADHRARVESVVDQAIREGRIEPRDRAMHLSHGAQQKDTHTFSAGDHKGKTAFGVWRDELLGRAANALFRPEPALEEPTDGAADEALRRRFAKHMPALRTATAQ